MLRDVDALNTRQTGVWGWCQDSWAATVAQKSSEDKKSEGGGSRRRLRWPKDPVFSHDPTEDCVWQVYSARDVKWVPRRGDKKRYRGPDPNAGVSGDVWRYHQSIMGKSINDPYGPMCFGLAPPTGDWRPPDEGGPERDLTQTITKCKFSMTDKPRERAPLGHWFAWQVLYLGVVYDTCNGWAIRQIREFPMTLTGNSGGKAGGTGRFVD